MPHVISMSYGMPEIGVTKGTSALFEAMMMKLAARGVTVLVASGDDGAASSLVKRVVGGEDAARARARVHRRRALSGDGDSRRKALPRMCCPSRMAVSGDFVWPTAPAGRADLALLVDLRQAAAHRVGGPLQCCGAMAHWLDGPQHGRAVGRSHRAVGVGPNPSKPPIGCAFGGRS